MERSLPPDLSDAMLYRISAEGHINELLGGEVDRHAWAQRFLVRTVSFISPMHSTTAY